MGSKYWGLLKDVDWILSALHVFTVTQLELKYAKSTIFRRAALVLNSVYTWTSQINADLIRRYTRQKHCLRASIKYQWPKSNWSRIYSWSSKSENNDLIWCMEKKCRDSYWQLQTRGILKFHEFTVSHLKSRYIKSNMFRKVTLILSLTYRRTSKIHGKFAAEVNKVRVLPKGFYKIQMTQKQLKWNLFLKSKYNKYLILIVTNSGWFTKNNLMVIQKLREGNDQLSRLKIGRYGIRFNVLYHIIYYLSL